MLAICVAGARPNFVKIKPVLDALERRAIDSILVHTGQHYDRQMSSVFFDDLGIRPPDVHLGVEPAFDAIQTGAIMQAFVPVVADHSPDVVLVVGDVNSTMACALVAAKSGALVAHVEAGLRSRDWSMPEEINRVVTDRVSDYLFAPSIDAAANLRREGYRDDQIQLVGNVMIDSLLSNLSRARERDILQRMGLERRSFGLVTLHRPSNVDDSTKLKSLMVALTEIATHVPLVFPVHPRTRATLEGIASSSSIYLTDPMGYLDFIALEDAARVVLTDSGGVQEETSVLGVCCLTIRQTTERPITVTEGTNTVVGVDPEQIVDGFLRTLDRTFEPFRPALWDGHASDRIADILLSGQGQGRRLRPTELEGSDCA